MRKKRAALLAVVLSMGMAPALALMPSTAMADTVDNVTCTTDATGMGTCSPGGTEPPPPVVGTTTGGVPYGACNYYLFYSYNRIHGSSIHAPGQIVYGQSGVTLTITETQGTTTTGTVGGSGSFSISGIVAGAETSVNASISWAKTSSITRGGSWKVPDSYNIGWLADGARSQRMEWAHWRQNGNCSETVLGSGHTNLPNQAPYIFHN